MNVRLKYKNMKPVKIAEVSFLYLFLNTQNMKRAGIIDFSWEGYHGYIEIKLSRAFLHILLPSV